MTRERLFTRPFVLVSLANLFQGMSFFLFVHLPRYLEDLGANAVLIGVIVGVTAIASIASRPAIGTIMDTQGRRPVILVGNVVNVGAILLYLTVSSLGPWIYVVRIIHGVAEASLFTALFTYGADVVPASRRTEGLALFGVSGLLPIALGGLLGDVVLAQAGFDELFLTAAAFAFGALVISLWLPERAPALEDTKAKTGYFEAIRRPDLLPIWFIIGAFSLVLTGYFTFLRTFIDDVGIGSVGLFFAFYAGTAIALRLAFAWLPARVGEKKVLFPALAAIAIGFVLLARVETSVDVALAGVMCGAGHGYAFPILFGFTVTRSPVAVRGATLSFFTALFDIGVLIGGPLLGFIISVSGYPAMYGVAAALISIASVIYWRWDRRYDYEDLDEDIPAPTP